MGRINAEVTPEPAPSGSTFEERRDAFALDLANLMRKHGVSLTSCGCCGGCGFTDLHRAEPLINPDWSESKKLLRRREADLLVSVCDDDLHETFNRLGENHR